MILPDVNLLVYAYNTDAPLHQQARRWWEICLDGSQPVAITWVVALGFLRLMTSRAVMERPMAMDVALSQLGRWLERPAHGCAHRRSGDRQPGGGALQRQ